MNDHPSAPPLSPQHSERIRTLLRQQTVEHGEHALRRVSDAVSFLLHEKTPTLPIALQRPSLMYFPGLDARGWHRADESELTRDVSRRLQHDAPRIREEALKCFKKGFERQSYVSNDYMKEKFSGVKQDDWTAVHFRPGMNNTPVADNLKSCPVTVEALRALEPHLLPHGEAFFSVLAPGVVLPEHFDDTNIKLTVQLPLVVPENCALQVAGEARGLREGECVFFEDTFLHTAWNKSDSPRVCLLMDIWNPELTAPERRAMTGIIELFYGAVHADESQ